MNDWVSRESASRNRDTLGPREMLPRKQSTEYWRSWWGHQLPYSEYGVWWLPIADWPHWWSLARTYLGIQHFGSNKYTHETCFGHLKSEWIKSWKGEGAKSCGLRS